MTPVLTLSQIRQASQKDVGAKAFNMAVLSTLDIRVPETLCIPGPVFDAYVNETRLIDRISYEINRKPLDKMRWEEIWDISLRIRNLFLTTPFPQEMAAHLRTGIFTQLGDRPVVVRSSAPGEDGKQTSFAGIHDSFVNVQGMDAILEHIRLVWASLYSDGALLYRKEMGLDVKKSRMAVVVQEMIDSEQSGIFFGQNPVNSEQAVIEAVWGYNQGLVDGVVAPDRWILSKDLTQVMDHIPADRDQIMTKKSHGLGIQPVDPVIAEQSPMNTHRLEQVTRAAKQIQAEFGSYQDIEFTFCKDILFVLQARPITALADAGETDKRAWYLSLHRSLENLEQLYEKIEFDLIPQMIDQAKTLGQMDLEGMSVSELIEEINRRQDLFNHWGSVYWTEFIPFAHGIRLFGQVYNDAVKPSDPYEFMRLLEHTGLQSTERNRMIIEMAGVIKQDKLLETSLEQGEASPNHPVFNDLLDRFINRFGDLSVQTGQSQHPRPIINPIINMVLEFSKTSKTVCGPSRQDRKELEKMYFNAFAEDKKEFAKTVLHLGRESFRLRDDDNIHLGRIESRLFEAIGEAKQRLTDPRLDPVSKERLLKLDSLSDQHSNDGSQSQMQSDDGAMKRWLRDRQIVGHPAGPGLAKGPARVIQEQSDLLDFKQGEILICKGVDPNMTFVVPLSAAVVEERGGMLIHGAIIAREYGLPCITGVPAVVERIKTGDTVTVDGYLGILTCEIEEKLN